MRKQTKLVAVLSSAALLAIGASMTSMAATRGWTVEDGEWVYLDRDGDRVTEEWKKSGNNYYWLDEDGLMAADQLVEDDDDIYYVDENGVRLTNQWISVPNEDDDEVNGEEVETLWYYLSSSGKAYAASNTDYKSYTIGGKKYFFDDEAHMLSGWFEDSDGNIYYLGGENEGWAYTGWQYLEIDEDIEGDTDLNGDEYDDEEWFYFQSSGKARRNTRKYISGAYYAFDENGVMNTEWIMSDGVYAAASSNSVSRVASENRAYYNENTGAQKTGWAYKYEENDQEGDENWYYLESSNKGTPFNYNGEKATTSSEATIYESGYEVDTTYGAGELAAKVIKSKTYLFDNTGAMLEDVLVVPEGGSIARTGGSDLGPGVYYFEKEDGSTNGQMATGKTTVTYDGDDYTYYFQSNGKAYTGQIKDSSLYDDMGVRLEADDGNSYEVIHISDQDYLEKVKINTEEYDAGTMVVSSSGKVKKSGTVTVDGTKYVISNYFVTKAYDKDDDDKNDIPSMYEEVHEYTETSDAE